MCEALREIWAEDFEQARNEGIELGYVKGVIESGKELGASREKVFKLVQEKFSLTSEATEENISIFSTTTKYVEELKSMNGLNRDTIHAGNSLVIAYYE